MTQLKKGNRNPKERILVALNYHYSEEIRIRITNSDSKLFRYENEWMDRHPETTLIFSYVIRLSESGKCVLENQNQCLSVRILLPGHGSSSDDLHTYDDTKTRTSKQSSSSFVVLDLRPTIRFHVCPLWKYVRNPLSKWKGKNTCMTRCHRLRGFTVS